MPRLPRLRGREVIAALRRAGFSVVRVRGSHHLVRHADARATVVPVHAGETIGPGLLSQILSDVDMERQEFEGFCEMVAEPGGFSGRADSVRAGYHASLAARRSLSRF